MKSFEFKLDGISGATLGRVDAIPVDEGINFTFVGGQIDKVLNSKSTDELDFYSVPGVALPLKNSDGSILDLNLGDVILFSPSGRCTIEYESHSFSNCILLTERCNSRCIMCVQPPKATSDSTELAKALIELIDTKTMCIGITGGEPTIAWDGLLQILKRCRERFPAGEIQLLSNARLLKDYEKSKALAEAGGDNLMVCVPIYCDIGQIHDEIVGVKGAFWETIEGIYNLERLSVPVEIRFVVQKLNYRRLPQWGEFVYRFFPFVRHVAIMAIEPIGLALKNLETVWIDPVDYTSFLDASIKIIHRRDLRVSIYNHQLCTLPHPLWKFAKKSISEWKNIFFKECSQCIEKSNCAGFFTASNNKKSRGINTIK